MLSEKPHVYLAGKITKHGWRKELVPNLRGLRFGQPVDCGSYIFNGPFFIACDHGCGHEPGAHGVNATRCTIPLGAPTRWTVPSLCHQWIAQSDLLFAWIDAPDCFNTLIEIGWAQQLGLRTYVSFRCQWLAQEMWFATLGPNVRWSVDRMPQLAFYDACDWAAKEAA
jgi:hypothetical protein